MKSLIKTEWVNSLSGKTIEVVNPATGYVIDTVPSLSKEEVDEAVDFAYAFQKEWAKKPIHERGSILLKFCKLVERDKESLAKLLSDETGKPIKEARAEISNVNVGIPAFVEKAKHEYGKVIPQGTEAGNEATIQYTTEAPIGVVAAIIPFNFPSDLFVQKVPPALLMGNAVILKPASVNPLTLTKYVELLLEAGVPAGAIQVVHGSGNVVGSALSSNKKVGLISLTGSTAAGIDTMNKASNHLGHVTLELGGNDAFILCEDGDVDLAVNETVWGRLYNTGQVCCASKRFLVHNSIKDEYISKMMQKISTLRVGMPSDEASDIGCLVSEEAAIEVEKQVNKTVSQGAKIICGGVRKGAFYLPTIIDNVTKDMDVAKDMEIFGPVISVIGFDTIEEAIEIANQSSFGLCGSIITKDMNKAFKVSEEIECGGFIINGASFFRSFEMPFGGWKYSGIGNEGVMTSLKEMTRTKTVILKNVLK